MASSLDGDASNSKVDDKKRRRKNPKPRHLSSYGKVQTPVQTTETEFKNDSDGEQMKKTTSSLEKQLVLEEPVLENLPIVSPQLRSDQIEDPQDRPEKVKNPESNNGFGTNHYVKIIRQLECSGIVESSFRQKFLTWFCLRATNQEKSVVKTFIHSFEDDSVAMAEQLVDLFAEILSRNGSTSGVSDGGGSTSGSLCKKPRH